MIEQPALRRTVMALALALALPLKSATAAPTLTLLMQGLQPGERGSIDGVFIRLECMSGTWFRVSYPRIVLPDGGIRHDPRPASFENTGRPCDQPAPQPIGNAQVAIAPAGLPGSGLFDMLPWDRKIDSWLPGAANESWYRDGGWGALYDGTFNPAPTANATVDPGVQKMIVESVLDDLQPMVAIASNEEQPRQRRWAGGFSSVMQRLVRLVRPVPQPSSALLTAADAGFRGDGKRNRGVWLAPIDAPAQTQAPEKPAGPPPIRMLFTSLGTSTGEAFQVAIVNDGDRPVLIDGMRLVLEPLKADTARRARSAMQKFQAEKPTTMKMTGYCLEFLRPPPIAGTLFRIAPKAAQQAAEPMRRILDAGSRLRREGRLTPDSEPIGYYHAIRQWAIWTKEQGFTEETFTNAFVEHTKKTFAASGHPWSTTAEQTLRQAAPGRWRDIQQVLAAAVQPR